VKFVTGTVDIGKISKQIADNDFFNLGNFQGANDARLSSQIHTTHENEKELGSHLESIAYQEGIKNSHLKSKIPLREIDTGGF
jgi:hypothetical protein